MYLGFFKKNWRVLAGLLLFILGFSALLSSLPYSAFLPDIPDSAVEETVESISSELFRVTRVIDGDTIELENNMKVRYIGIDTPETVAPNQKVECFGQEASLKNKELVEGKYVRLETDVSETDRYGRQLRYVYVDGVFVNEYLVRNGYANASSYPPDIKYQEQLRSAEKQARTENLGLWGNCKLD